MRHSNNLKNGTEGWFVANCEVDASSLPGKYHLEYVSILDIYGNKVDSSTFWRETVAFELV